MRGMLTLSPAMKPMTSCGCFLWCECEVEREERLGAAWAGGEAEDGAPPGCACDCG